MNARALHQLSSGEGAIGFAITFKLADKGMWRPRDPLLQSMLAQCHLLIVMCNEHGAVKRSQAYSRAYQICGHRNIICLPMVFRKLEHGSVYLILNPYTMLNWPSDE